MSSRAVPVHPSAPSASVTAMLPTDDKGTSSISDTPTLTWVDAEERATTETFDATALTRSVLSQGDLDEILEVVRARWSDGGLSFYPNFYTILHGVQTIPSGTELLDEEMAFKDVAVGFVPREDFTSPMDKCERGSAGVSFHTIGLAHFGTGRSLSKRPPFSSLDLGAQKQEVLRSLTKGRVALRHGRELLRRKTKVSSGIMRVRFPIDGGLRLLERGEMGYEDDSIRANDGMTCYLASAFDREDGPGLDAPIRYFISHSHGMVGGYGKPVDPNKPGEYFMVGEELDWVL